MRLFGVLEPRKCGSRVQHRAPVARLLLQNHAVGLYGCLELPALPLEIALVKPCLQGFFRVAR